MWSVNNFWKVNEQRIIELNKFFLSSFNCLTHNRKISRLLVTNTLLDLLKFYASEKILKKVNMRVFQSYFPKIIFQEAEDEDTAESFIPSGISKMMLTSFVDNYYY